MSAETGFTAVHRELDLWQEKGQVARFWLRDDDAHAPCKELDRLLEVTRRHQAFCLLAVIPMLAGELLAERLQTESLTRIAVHGLWHKNNAAKGQRAEEMATVLGIQAIRSALTIARAKMVSLFGEDAGVWYVPPWNRISDAVAAQLPELGFSAVSAFGPARFGFVSRLNEWNTHVDFLHWKTGGAGHTAPTLAEKLLIELTLARREGYRPIGLLTHHLSHDETAWSVLEAVLSLLSAHPAARWLDPAVLLDSTPNAV